MSGVPGGREAGIFSIKLLCSIGMALKHNIPPVLCLALKYIYGGKSKSSKTS